MTHFFTEWVQERWEFPRYSFPTQRISIIEPQRRRERRGRRREEVGNLRAGKEQTSEIQVRINNSFPTPYTLHPYSRTLTSIRHP
jgi:hypothetical protein